MADSREQRMAEKFWFLLWKTGTETLEILKTAYKNDAIGKTLLFEWFYWFKSGVNWWPASLWEAFDG